jgi:hypothetical protein
MLTMADFGKIPTKLVDVIRTVKRKLADGTTKEYKRTFKVKKAAPGDTYGKVKRQSAAPPTVTPGDPQSQVDQEQEQEAQPLPRRFPVEAHDVPWELENVKDDDPIPSEIRKKFHKDNKELRVQSVAIGSIPFNSISASDCMLWGASEPELLSRLRTGRICSIRSAGQENATMLAKVEYADGARHAAYLKIEGLNDPHYYARYGAEYGLSKTDGTMAFTAAAAYEVAKAIGMDDIVPPTVVRWEDYGNLDTILPAELIERREIFTESIAVATGSNKDDITKALGGYGSLQLYVPDCYGLDSQEWFTTLSVEALNSLILAVPENIMIAMCRMAALDFVLWISDRNILDLRFRDNGNICVLGNNVCLPDPFNTVETHAAMVPYLNPANGQLPPWSDFILMVALHGDERIMATFEKICLDVCNRLTKDRCVELTRVLHEHKISKDAIAAAVCRARLLGKMSSFIIKDPFFYIRCMKGNAVAEDPAMVAEFARVVEYVNDVMTGIHGDPYDFLARFIPEDPPEEGEDENAG